MKDSELRGIVLNFLYEHRREPSLVFGNENKNFKGSVAIPESIDPDDWLRACSQLGDYNVIEWKPFQDHTGLGLLGGAAKINGFGTSVIEDEQEPPLPIVIDQRQYIQVTSSQAVQIAGAHSQQTQNMTDAFAKVVNAFDKADVTEAEKQKAKSLLVKVLESKAAAAILGPVAGVLIKQILS